MNSIFSRTGGNIRSYLGATIESRENEPAAPGRTAEVAVLVETQAAVVGAALVGHLFENFYKGSLVNVAVVVCLCGACGGDGLRRGHYSSGRFAGAGLRSASALPGGV